MNILEEIKSARANRPIAEEGFGASIAIYDDIVSLIGLREDKLPDNDGHEKIVTYIFKNMGDYTKQEVSLAFTLYVKGKLDFEKDLYDKISPLFIENVMQSYRRLRVSLVPSPGIEADRELTANEKRAIMVENILKQFELYRKTGKFVDFGNFAYKELAKQGILSMGYSQAKSCIEQACRNVARDFNKKSSGFLSISDMRALYGRQMSKNRNMDIHYEARLIAVERLFNWFVINNEELTDYLKR